MENISSPIQTKKLRAIKEVSTQIIGSDGVLYNINLYKGSETGRTYLSIEAILEPGHNAERGPSFDCDIETFMRSRIEDFVNQRSLQVKAEEDYRKTLAEQLKKLTPKKKRAIKKISKLIKKAKKK